MKKICLLLSLCLLFNRLSAQNEKFEVRGGWGYLSDSHAAEILGNSVGTFIISFFGKHDFRITTRGAFSGDVLVALHNPKWQLTTTYATEKIEVTEYNNDAPSSFAHNVTAILPGIHYNYVRDKGFSFYSGIAMGVKLLRYDGHTSTSTVANVGYQFTALGFRFGNKLGGFLEGGFGSKGLIRGGIAYAF